MRSVFLASATRSGSTHIANTLVRYGFRRASLHYGFEYHANEDYTIDTMAAQLLIQTGGWVFQSHARAVGRNAPLLKEFDVPVVVTGRNIFDSLLSIKERTDVDWGLSGGDLVRFRNTTHLPLHLPDWGRMDDRSRFEWMAYNVIPWYLSFYASWLDAEVNKMWIWYEDYFANQPDGLGKILEHVGVPIPSRVTLDTLSRPTDGKFSVGVAGRGIQQLPHGIPDKVIAQIEAYRLPIELKGRLLCSGV